MPELFLHPIVAPAVVYHKHKYAPVCLCCVFASQTDLLGALGVNRFQSISNASAASTIGHSQ